MLLEWAVGPARPCRASCSPCSPCGSWWHGNASNRPQRSKSALMDAHSREKRAHMAVSCLENDEPRAQGRQMNEGLRGGRAPPPCVSTEARGASGLGSPRSGRARPTPGATKSVRGETLSAAPRLSLDFQCHNWYKEGLPPVRGCAGAVGCPRAGLGLARAGAARASLAPPLTHFP